MSATSGRSARIWSKRGPSVPGGRDECELSGARHDPGEAVEEHRVVIGDDDADGHTPAILPRP